MSAGITPRTMQDIDTEIASTVGRVRELKRLRYEKTTAQGADFRKIKKEGIRLGMVNRKKNKKRDVAAEINRTSAAEIAQIQEKLDEVKGMDKELNTLRKKLDNLEAEKARLAGKEPSLSQNQRRRAVVKEKRLHSNVKKIAKLVKRIDQQEQNEQQGEAGPSSSAPAQYFGGGGQPQSQPKSTAELREKLGRIEAMVGGRLGGSVQQRHLPGLAPPQGSYDNHYQRVYPQPLPAATQGSRHQPLLLPTSQDNYQPTHSQVLQGDYSNRYHPPQPPSVRHGSYDQAPYTQVLQGNYGNRYQPTSLQPPWGSYGGHDQAPHARATQGNYSNRHQPPHSQSPSGSESYNQAPYGRFF